MGRLRRSRCSGGPLALCLLGLTAAGCGGRQPSGLPPPAYERPHLPPWEPPQNEDEEDPFADLSQMEGEWVVEEEESQEGDAPGPDPSDSDPNAEEAPESDGLPPPDLSEEQGDTGAGATTEERAPGSTGKSDPTAPDDRENGSK